MESIGDMIKQELEQQGRSVSWLAARLHCNRTNVYNIFMRHDIDLLLLSRISKILGRNFVREWADHVEAEIDKCQNNATNCLKM